MLINHKGGRWSEAIPHLLCPAWASVAGSVSWDLDVPMWRGMGNPQTSE